MIENLVGGNIWLAIIIRVIVGVVPIVGVFATLALVEIWLERKVSGHIQSRRGPLHVGVFLHGIPQGVADAIKLLGKEDLTPKSADWLLFRLAPYISVAPVLMAFLIIPFSPQFTFDNSFNIGVLYLLAVLGVEVIGTIMAGWGSNSKWSIYGAMREACQMVSYEIPLGLAIICGVLIAGTLNMEALTYMQGQGVWDWLIFHNPFMFIAFFVYFIASLASNKRAPFDLPESESELVAGFLTEYSGIRWSIFFMGEYNGMFIVGCIQAILFMGGWTSPLGVFDPIYAEKLFWILPIPGIGYDPVAAGAAYANGSIAAANTWSGTAEAMGVSSIGLIILNLYSAFWLFAKAMTIVLIQIWLRWTLPRIRIDQVLFACVKVLLPISLICLFGVAVWVWLVDAPDAETLAKQHGLIIWHLGGEKMWLQNLTQFALTGFGLLIVASFIGVVIWAWMNRHEHPQKSFFNEAMPVGKDVTFMTTPKPVVEEAGE